jgi:hypothetical protein
VVACPLLKDVARPCDGEPQMALASRAGARKRRAEKKTELELGASAFEEKVSGTGAVSIGFDSPPPKFPEVCRGVSEACMCVWGGLSLAAGGICVPLGVCVVLDGRV